MAKRDVELIIRAKDEAARAIDSVSKALRLLVTSQSDVTSSAGKTDTALTRLGSAVAGLNKQFAGLTSVARATANMDRATLAMNRLQGETAQTAQEQERISKATGETAARMQQLSLEADQTAQAIARQRAQLTGSKAAQSAYSAEIKTTEAALAKMERQETSLTNSIIRQDAAVVRSAARYGDLASKLASAVAPSATLTKQTVEASAALEKQEASLLGLAASQERNRVSMQQTSVTLGELKARLAAANADFRLQSTELAKLESGYKQIVNQVRATAQSQQELQTASVETATALQRQQQEIKDAEVALAAASGEMDKLTAAQAKLASAGVGVLIRALKEQQAVTVKARVEWKALAAAAGELKAQLVSTAEPTEKMVADYERLRAAAIQARAEFNAQGAALGGLRAALFEVRGGTIGLAEAQQRFAATQTGLASSLRGIRSESGVAATELGRLAVEATKAATSTKQLQASTAGYTQVAGAATAKTTTFANALRLLYGNSRTAMSWTQRLRSEVLSLIAAYGGIFGAIQGVRNLIDATVTLERVQSRLGVIFEGDLGRVSDEMAFLKRNADFLGISLGVLADQYSKFASSTLDTNIEGQKTRDIFLAVSDAAAVLGLSTDDVQGVFKALSQIASKSQVQMEELRGQLGDRFPAALQSLRDKLPHRT